MRCTRRTAAVPKLQQCALCSICGRKRQQITIIYYYYYVLLVVTRALTVFLSPPPRRRSTSVRRHRRRRRHCHCRRPWVVGALELARCPCLFVNGLENWFHVYYIIIIGIYTFLFIPRGLLLFLYACLHILLLSSSSYTRGRRRNKKKKNKRPVDTIALVTYYCRTRCHHVRVPLAAPTRGRAEWFTRIFSVLASVVLPPHTH